MKHGYSSNQGISDIREENIAARHFTLYGNDVLRLSSAINDSVTSNILSISELTTGGGVNNRFPIGTYIQIRDEIMRVVSSGNTTQLTVIRGSLGTRKQSHPADSLIKKIKPIAVEFRRPSILRASGHTFEYLGYGPGNYSTGLPQVQNRTLTDDEEYLSQAQERSSGVVVYTGLNNEGDFYIGNKRISSSSGEESSFGIPIPTVTGETASNNSVVFDEIIVRQRIIVEGGPQQNILSQFDGPVTFSNDVNFTDDLITSGTVDLGGTIEITGSFPNGAKMNNVLVGVGTQQTEITTVPGSGDLVLNAASGFSVAIATDTKYNAKVTFEKQVNFNGFTTFSGDVFMSGAGFTYCGGPLHVCDDIVAFYGQTSDLAMKENVSTLEDPLAKVMQIRGTEYDWKEGNKSYKGHDVGVIAQDVERVLPEAVSTKPDGTKGVHYNKLIPLLIEAVKDLSQQVDELKDK